MRNKANRLEECLFHWLMKNKEIAHDASLLGALKSIWAKEIHRFMRIWVQS